MDPAVAVAVIESPAGTAAEAAECPGTAMVYDPANAARGLNELSA